MANKVSNINIQVEVDENHVPESLNWTAEDGGVKDEEAKAMLLSIWDSKQQETLRIDLWTKDMMVNEMYIMYHQTLISMANTLEKSTGHDKLAGALKDYCKFFAEQTKIIDSK